MSPSVTLELITQPCDPREGWVKVGEPWAIRDWFAGLAMQEIIDAHIGEERELQHHEDSFPVWAKCAYKIADCLLEARTDDPNEPYAPPYEADQGGLKPEEPAQVGEDVNFTESQDLREPDLPQIQVDDSPAGGVDRRGESGDQGDDDLKRFSGN